MKPLLLALAMLGTLAFWAERPSFAEGTDISARLQSLLTSFQDEYKFPGATVSYILPDGTIGDAAVGLADAEEDLRMSPETRMLAASIGKTIVGALVLSLEAEGVLKRSDLVSVHLGKRTWFSRLPNAAEITVGHLLKHTAGLPDHVHMKTAVRELIERGNEEDVRPEDAIAFVLDQPPLFKAGAAWSYSDTGYLLLGLAIEAATERDFYDLADERFLVPLGLTYTSASTSPVLTGLAVGYTDENNRFGLPVRTMDRDGALLWNPAIEWTGGGFISTSHDLAKWGHALFSGAVLQTPYVDRLLDGTPIDPDTPGILYGSGVAIHTETEYGPVYGHGGWVPGYVSSLRHYAKHGITIAFQINTDVGIADDRTNLVPALETALASLLIKAVPAE